MNHIYNSLKDGTTYGYLDEFAHIAYNHGDGDYALGKVIQSVLTWCSEEALVYFAHTLLNKLVLQMMMIFKNLQRAENKQLVYFASMFHVAVDEE